MANVANAVGVTVNVSHVRCVSHPPPAHSPRPGRLGSGHESDRAGSGTLLLGGMKRPKRHPPPWSFGAVGGIPERPGQGQKRPEGGVWSFPEGLRMANDTPNDRPFLGVGRSFGRLCRLFPPIYKVGGCRGSVNHAFPRTPARVRRGRCGGEREAVVPHPLRPKGWTGHRDGPRVAQACLGDTPTRGIAVPSAPPCSR